MHSDPCILVTNDEWKLIFYYSVTVVTLLWKDKRYLNVCMSIFLQKCTREINKPHLFVDNPAQLCFGQILCFFLAVLKSIRSICYDRLSSKKSSQMLTTFFFFTLEKCCVYPCSSSLPTAFRFIQHGPSPGAVHLQSSVTFRCINLSTCSVTVMWTRWLF